VDTVQARGSFPHKDTADQAAVGPAAGCGELDLADFRFGPADHFGVGPGSMIGCAQLSRPTRSRRLAWC